MPKQFARKDLSAIGFYLILGIVLGNLALIMMLSAFVSIKAVGVVLGSGEIPGPDAIMDITASIQVNPLFLLIANTLSVYLIGFGIIYLMTRHRFPSIRGRQLMAAEGDPVTESAVNRAPGTMTMTDRPGFSRTDALALIPIIIFLMDVGDLIGTAIARLCGDQFGVEASNQRVEALLSGNLWQTILFVVVLAPAAEELFFRKYLIDRFDDYSARGAILLSAVSFALFHQNFFQIFYSGFIGAILAWIYIKTKNVLYPIVIHVFVNFFGGIVMPACMAPVVAQREVFLAGDPEMIAAFWQKHPESLIFVSIYAILSLIGMILLLIRIRQRRFRVSEAPDAMPLKDFVRAYVTAPGQIAYLFVCVALTVYVLVLGAK